MKNKIRCAGQDYLATLQAEPARIRYAPSRCWGCRPISLITSHAHSEFATLLPHGRLAPYNKKEDVTS